MTNSTLAIADKTSYIAPLNHAVNSVLSDVYKRQLYYFLPCSLQHKE